MSKIKKHTSSLYSTDDYSIFIRLKQNRDICEQHVKKLIENIAKRDLTMDNPILVEKTRDNTYIILDGQHRYESCIRLKKPIYFTNATNSHAEDISALQLARKWASEDYLKMYVELKYPEYLKFKSFREEFQLDSLTFTYTLLTLMNQELANENARMAVSSRFKTGKYKHPADETLARTLISQINDLRSIKRIPFTSNFQLACLSILKDERYEHKRMVRQLKKYSFLLSESNTKTGYFRMLEDIYNKRLKETMYIKFTERLVA